MNPTPSNLPSISRRWHRLAALFSLLLCLGFVATARASGPYCAIAFSPSTYSHGWSHSWPTAAEAESAALANCQVFDARIVVSVRNGYGALAIDKGAGRYGYGYGATKAIAQRNALNGCGTRNARIVRTVWSGV